MAKLKIGKIDLTSEQFYYFFQAPDRYLRQTIQSITLREKFRWSCKDQAFEPPNAPMTFKGIEPHLLIYRNSRVTQKDRKRIDRDSQKAGQAFLRLSGYSNGLDLEADLNSQLGVHDIPFDAGPMIANQKNFRLKLRADLTFRQFRLRHPLVPYDTFVVLSLPHTVVISAKRVHLCTPGAPAVLPAQFQYFKTVGKKMVRAQTETSFAIRRKQVDAGIQHENLIIDQAKKRLEERKQQLKDITPKQE